MWLLIRTLPAQPKCPSHSKVGPCRCQWVQALCLLCTHTCIAPSGMSSIAYLRFSTAQQLQSTLGVPSGDFVLRYVETQVRGPLVCDHVPLVCDHVPVVCDHVPLVCDHVPLVCDHVPMVCDHVPLVVIMCLWCVIMCLWCVIMCLWCVILLHLSGAIWTW